MLKKILIVLSLLAAVALGVWLTRYYYDWHETKVQEESQVLLDKIDTVVKLITVEGYFSEIYDYKDYWGYDLSFFRKKALLRVKAKVSVGYDLSNVKIESRPDEKRILISNLPDPQILSIDHDIDYYDISEGTFNYFSAEDYTRLNHNAKSFIETKAKESDLFMAAEKQGVQLLDMVQFLVVNAGWTFEYLPRNTEKEVENMHMN
ncbi:MAG: DUF4230 domain-containing protein [Bacteroidetes bacterium]|nr:DUF4230 domain-containing protein [Bacteroidota bacterium]